MSTAGTESVVLRVDGSQPVGGGQTGISIRRKDYSAHTDSVRSYVVSGGGVRQYIAAGADALDRAFDGTEVMRWPAYAGDSFVQLDTTVDSDRDFDGDGKADRVSLLAQVSVIGIESVTVPAGTFGNALHQRTVLKQTLLPSAGGAPALVTTTTDAWYAPGVGVVRSVAVKQGDSAGGTVTEELTRYRFGDLHSAYLTFDLQSSTPIATGPGSAPIQAVFNVDVDETSFAPGVFTLKDGSGQAVAGTVKAGGRNVRFLPAQALKSGAYTAVIGTAAQDLLGTTMAAPRQWIFIIDASAPRVLGSSPHDDSINVDLKQTLGVELSEAPDAATVNASTVKLTQGGIAVPATVSVNDHSIVIEPVGGLQRGLRYSVALSGITDLVGNTLADAYSFSFTTTPGRFAEAEDLFGPRSDFGQSNRGVVPAAVAIGDANGDGIPDVVFTDWGPTGGLPMALYVRTGRADGSLNDAVPVDLGTFASPPSGGYCLLNALAVGDVTGDGRADIVVGAQNCGVQVLRQTAEGKLELGQFLNTAVNLLRIADVNGDGRLDLVGVHRGLSVAVIWTQTSDGSLVLGQTPTLGDFGAWDVAIGDLDGDGRQDLVVSLLNVQKGPNIAILRQLADGTFAAPTYLSTGSDWGATGVAIGDLNGDGRPDIVATTGGNAPTWLAVFYQAADRSFPSVSMVPTQDSPWSVAVADFNGDGRADVVVMHKGWNEVGFYLQQADGSLGREELYAGRTYSVYLQALAIGDLNRDGRPDVVVTESILRQLPLSGTGALARALRNSRRPN